VYAVYEDSQIWKGLISGLIYTVQELDMVAHTCNPALVRLRQEDGTFETILGYTVRSCLKNNNKELKQN
jgi:hypothetical protein